MKITIVTKYDGRSADIFVGAVSKPLAEITEKQRRILREAFDCDGAGETDEDDDDASNLFFREVEVTDLAEICLSNADGEV